jgi:hypothetical protein
MYLLSHLLPRRKQLQRRVNALLRSRFQFFKQQKPQMLLQKHLVALKRKLLQKILRQQLVQQAQQVMTVIQIHATATVAVAVVDEVVVAHKVKVLKALM